MSGVSFRCCAHGDVGRRDFDIPAWMFDPVTCSTMTLSVIPMVDMEALIQLRRLLDCALGRKEFGMVEGGHRLEVTQDRTHWGLGKETPGGRTRSLPSGHIGSQPRLGGLHHRYDRAA